MKDTTWNERTSSANKELEEKAKRQHEEGIKRARERVSGLLKKLLNGDPLKAEEGRELFWTCVVNGNAMHIRTYTGNAQTYYNCGLRDHAELWIRELKENISLDLFHEMEREAYSRSKKGRLQ